MRLQRGGSGVLTLVTALTLGVFSAAGALAQFPEPPTDPVSCAIVQQGQPGPAGDVLRVSEPAGSSASISRRGQEIEVIDYTDLAEPVKRDCTGAVPTVTNIDAIEVDVPSPNPAAGTALSLDFFTGAFAPGATPEAQGDSEIEITNRPGPDPGINEIRIVGRALKDDHMRISNPGDRWLVVELDVTERGSDRDIVMHEPGTVKLLGGAGDDRIVVKGHGPFEALEIAGQSGNDVLKGSGGSINGGVGNDLLRGGAFGESLQGRNGRDRVFGRGSGDFIYGGLGSDLLVGGVGGDRVFARGEGSDRVSCGPHFDRVNADRRDRLDDCEDVSR